MRHWRIYCTAAQRAEIWDRWQRGESMSSIGRRFDRESSSIFSLLSPSGGIRPPASVFRERHAFRPGETIRLKPDPLRAHLFDAASGLRLTG